MFSEVGQREPVFGSWARELLRFGLLGLLLVTAAVLWMVSSPLPWTLLAERLVRDLPGHIEVQDIDITGPGDPLDPTTWEFTLIGVTWTPDSPEQPAFQVDRVVAPLPDWTAWQAHRELHVPWARIVGLDLHLPTQRPPPPWEPSDDPLALRIDRVELWDTRLQVDEDDPLPALTAGEIYGELESVYFTPGTRNFTGRGHGRVGILQYGDLPFSGATVGSIVADERGLALEGVAFGLAAGEGLASLRFEGLLKTAATMTLDAEFKGVRLQDVVAATSDRRSPIRGRVSATAQMQTDPAAERGSGELTALVQVPELMIPLDINLSKTGPVLRGVLELFGFHAGDGLRIKSLYGPIRLGRGTVDLDGLRSTLLGMPIELRAHIDDAGVWILVRRLPRLKNLGSLSRVTGAIGLVIEGRHDHLWLRVANETEMKAGHRVGPYKNEGVKVGG